MRNSVSDFLSEFKVFMESVLTYSGRLLIVGDFNIHVNKPDGEGVAKFLDLLDDMNLQQHVVGPTHEKGNTLDLVISRKGDSLVEGLVEGDHFFSDHKTIPFEVLIQKPLPPVNMVKEITYRKVRNLDLEKLKADIRGSEVGSVNIEGKDLNSLVHDYNSSLSEIFDTHAPEVTKRVTIRPSQPWYNDNIRAEKQKVRQLERKWRASKLEGDRIAFKVQRQLYSDMLMGAVTQYYSELIDANKNDQKALFQIVKKLSDQKHDTPYPEGKSNKTLADDFSKFFINKIEKIRENLDKSPQLENALDSSISTENSSKPTPFADFKPLSLDETKNLIKDAASKSCELDPIPTKILQQCIEELAPIIMAIIMHQ